MKKILLFLCCSLATLASGAQSKDTSAGDEGYRYARRAVAEAQREIQNAQREVQNAMRDYQRAQSEYQRQAYAQREVTLAQARAERDVMATQREAYLAQAQSERQAVLAQSQAQRQMALAQAQAERSREQAARMADRQARMAERQAVVAERRRRNNEMLDEMVKDHLIKRGTSVKIEFRDNHLYINDQEQPAAVYEKYKQYGENNETLQLNLDEGIAI